MTQVPSPTAAQDRKRALKWLAPAALAGLVAFSAWRLDLGPGRLQRAAQAARTFFQDFWPPDFSIWREALVGLEETLYIAVIATVAGFVLSLPLAVLAATTLSHPAVAASARAVASAIRVPPSLLWAIVAVIIVGPGPLAGTLAMTVYSVGYLAKLQYEALEGIPRDALEAAKAMGMGHFASARHVALPEAQNALRSQALFMFEYNVRASTVVGVVGAGGVGQLLKRYLDFFQYDRVSAALIMLLLVVFAIDALSWLVRRSFVEDPGQGRPRWRDLLRPGASGAR